MGAPRRQRQVVTAFLSHEGRVLLVRRSERVSTYRGRWAGISGGLERAPLEQALTEIAEETSLGATDVTLVRAGEPLTVDDPDLGTTWTVHPFLFAVRDPTAIRLDWEHVESRWVEPCELCRHDVVPGLAEALGRVWQ